MGGNNSGHYSTNNNNDGNLKTANSVVTYLRLMFITLSVACLMQLSYQYGGGGGGSGSGGSSATGSIFGCTTILYNVGNENDDENEGVNSNTNQHLRKIDPDVPINSYIKKKKKKKDPSIIEIESNKDNESNEDIKIESNEVKEKEIKIPKFMIDAIYKKEQDRIDYNITDEYRCQQYGVNVLPLHERNKKRIFFGSMLANENSDILLAHAIEVYNLYHVISFVESNTTHFNTPRPMNYYPLESKNAKQLIDSELFGSSQKTNVFIDYWLEDQPELLYMQREVEQRNTIWKRWITQGMQPNDIGIMADLDEIVSRDFLQSLQVCDYPKLQHDPSTRPDCQAPKMILSSIQFEGSPQCIKQYEWFHPDIILGNCILDVGDNSGRVIPERNINKNSHGNSHLNVNINKGNRQIEWGTRDYNNYPQDILDSKRFPLWDGRDIREVNGNEIGLTNYVHPYNDGHGTSAAYGTAYHLHNWFNDLDVLRHKYATYGHAYKEAITDPLSKIQGDLDTLVRCHRNLGNDVVNMPHDAVPYYIINHNNNSIEIDVEEEDGEDNSNDNDKVGTTKKKVVLPFNGNRPIFFQNLTYVKERNELVTKLIQNDEKKYKSYYP